MAQPTTLEQTTGSIEHAESAPTGLAALGIDTPFLLAQVVNFFVLFFLLRWLLYRPILDVLKKRRTTIEESLKHAQAAQAAAEEADQKSAATVREAREQATQIVDQAKEQATKIAADLKAQATAESEALLERTRTQLAQEKAAVLGEAQQELSSLVIRATERVVAGQDFSVDPTDVQSAIAEVNPTSPGGYEGAGNG